MRLPALRLAFLRKPAADTLSAALGELFLGTTLVLPADLPEAEHEEICDLAAFSLGLPLHVTARTEGLPAGHVCVITEPVDRDPAPVNDGLVIAVRAREAGRRRLGSSHALRRLRDVVLQAVGSTGSGFEEIAGWAQEVADSPSTALRFASAARRQALASPLATPSELVVEGLAETLAWLLRGVDPRVAEWVLAHAVAAKNPGRLVSTEAALLGETAALQRALAAGLVEHLPERRDDPEDVLDLRRPLSILGQLDDLSAPVDLPAFAAALRPRLDPLAHRVFDRLLRARPRPLGFSPPTLPLAFLGRDEVLERLDALLEPSHEIRTVVVYGVGGIGKSAVGAALCARLAERLEPVWLTFAGGPEAAWQRVAEGLGIDTQKGAETRTPAGTPSWLPRVHRAIAERDALIVADDVETVPESELPAWLPAGPGSCAVLVLSRQSQRVLQREHDAIAVSLQALRDEEARALLSRTAPALAEPIRRGEADALLRELGSHPAAVRIAAGLLEKRSIDEVLALLRQGDHEISGLARPALAALGDDEKKVVDALAVAAPTGSPHGLVARMVAVEDVRPILVRLADRALVELGPRLVRLQAIVQLAALGVMGEERRRALEVEHARVADAVMEAAREGKDDTARDEGYADAMLALARMTERCRAGEETLAELVSRVAHELHRYRRGRVAETLSAVIAGWRAVLAVSNREGLADRWANAQEALGQALLDLPVGNRVDNVRQAIDAFGAALTVYTNEKNPGPWANVQRRVGVAYSLLPVGDQAENLRRGIDAFQGALTVLTEHANPKDWARTQIALGNALLDLPDGDAAENRRRAIEAYEATLRVFTRQTSPEDWAGVQNNLGLAYTDAPHPARDLRRAIEAFQRALSVYVLPAYPENWAAAQLNLGRALAQLSEGDRDDNRRRAIEAFRAALTVYTREAFPWDWARTQANLGYALMNIESGERRQNLARAADAYRSALTVYTEHEFPREHALAQSHLELTLRVLAALDVDGDPDPAPAGPGARPADA